MPFKPDVKMMMFIRCDRYCCLCRKQCDTNIEAAHIIAESEGGTNDEENGIPLCFDCHQKIGSYNDKHPKGNKMRPEELRARRNRVYELVAQGKIGNLQPANLPLLFERHMELKTSGDCFSNPTIAQLMVAIDKLDSRSWKDAYLILEDCAWENAYLQVCQEPSLLFIGEYRDGATQLHYRTVKEIGIETVKLMFLTYLDRGCDFMRYAIEWKDVTATLSSAHR